MRKTLIAGMLSAALSAQAYDTTPVILEWCDPNYHVRDDITVFYWLEWRANHKGKWSRNWYRRDDLIEGEGPTFVEVGVVPSRAYYGDSIEARVSILWCQRKRFCLWRKEEIVANTGTLGSIAFVYEPPGVEIETAPVWPYFAGMANGDQCI